LTALCINSKFPFLGPPIVHPGVPLYQNITTPLKVPVVLRLSAIAYPVPSTVAWQRLNGGKWSTITPNSHISIQQANLNYSLTINEVVKADFGQYKLVIENKVGQFEQIFNIIFGGTNLSSVFRYCSIKFK
jgi:hypothetical protein